MSRTFWTAKQLDALDTLASADGYMSTVEVAADVGTDAYCAYRRLCTLMLDGVVDRGPGRGGGAGHHVLWRINEQGRAELAHACANGGVPGVEIGPRVAAGTQGWQVCS